MYSSPLNSLLVANTHTHTYTPSCTSTKLGFTRSRRLLLILYNEQSHSFISHTRYVCIVMPWLLLEISSYRKTALCAAFLGTGINVAVRPTPLPHPVPRLHSDSLTSASKTPRSISIKLILLNIPCRCLFRVPGSRGPSETHAETTTFLCSNFRTHPPPPPRAKNKNKKTLCQPNRKHSKESSAEIRYCSCICYLFFPNAVDLEDEPQHFYDRRSSSRRNHPEF